MTSKEKLLATKPKLIKRTIQGTEVYYKPMSRKDFFKLLDDDNGDKIAITECLCNKDGSQMFTFEEAQNLLMPVFKELVQEALRINGVTPAGN